MKILIFLFIFISCESRPLNRGEKRDLDNVSIGVQSFQYFLEDIPEWANLNSSGNCFRKQNIRYLDFDKINKSFALSYQKLIHFQHMVNRRMLGLSQAKGERIDVKDENALFYNVYEQIQGGVTDFVIPEYNEISLFWIDPILEDKKALEKMIAKIKDPNLTGYPIIISFCKQDAELDNFIIKYKIDEISVKKMGPEFLSLYNHDFSISTNFHIHLIAFLGEKKINFYTTTDLRTSELPDQMKIIKY
jgi:hypothetical protein